MRIRSPSHVLVSNWRLLLNLLFDWIPHFGYMVSLIWLTFVSIIVHVYRPLAPRIWIREGPGTKLRRMTRSPRLEDVIEDRAWYLACARPCTATLPPPSHARRATSETAVPSCSTLVRFAALAPFALTTVPTRRKLHLPTWLRFISCHPRTGPGKARGHLT